MSEIVTAGILVIGDEILSGRTKDKNIGFIAEYLTNIPAVTISLMFIPQKPSPISSVGLLELAGPTS